MQEQELRTFKAFFEVRGKPSKIYGSIPYNKPSLPIDGGFIEYLKPGAFRDALKSGKDIKSYWSHNREKVIGSTKAGTLRLTDTPTELQITLDPGSTSWGQDALESVRRGDVSGFSFGFIPEEEDFDGMARYILKANLLEVSPVGEPAYPASKAYARSIKKQQTKILSDEEKMKRFERDRQYWLKDTKFKSMSDMFTAVQKATEFQISDPRLQDRASGLSEGISSDGGFKLDNDFSMKLFDKSNVSPLWTRAFKIPLKNSNRILLPTWDETSRVSGSLLGGINFQWLAESDEKSYSNPKFRQLDMSLHKTAAMLPYTAELRADAKAFESVLNNGLQRGLNIVLEEAIVRGSGVGRPQGLINQPCKITIAKESGQSAATIVAANVSKMLERIPPESYANGDIIWVTHPSTIPQLAELYKEVGTGGSVNPLWAWRSGGELFNKLMGFDVIISDQCNTLGTEGDLILTDISQTVITYRPAKTAISIHVLFSTDEELFRFVFRVNAQNAWAKSVTPAQGSNKISPVVTLATRA
jgi:HK97 family phage major capsid protein/HK97 family phage prohead protease